MGSVARLSSNGYLTLILCQVTWGQILGHRGSGIGYTIEEVTYLGDLMHLVLAIVNMYLINLGLTYMYKESLTSPPAFMIYCHGNKK